MKLFKVVDHRSMGLDSETVDYLLNSKIRGSTITRIRDLIANLYNCNYYDVDLFRLMRNADAEHAELALDIIESCSFKNGDICFKMINDLAPKIIEHFGYDEKIQS